MAMDDDEVKVVVSANTSDSEIVDYLAETNIKKKQLTVFIVVRKLREISQPEISQHESFSVAAGDVRIHYNYCERSHKI